jgi:hypothetical protein
VAVVNLLELKPGMRVKLADGTEAEIRENPADGMWVFGRLQGGTSDEEPIFAQDIVEIVS